MLFCMGCSTGDDASVVEHMSLQYDGSEVLIPQPPDNSKSLSQDAIFCRGGYSVNLVEEHHLFFTDNVIKESTTAVRATTPPYFRSLRRR